jgi:hypothetical protein
LTPRERLLVQQTRHAVLLRDARQHVHDHLLVIGRQVGVLVQGSQLILGRRYLVVPRFDRDTQLEQLALGVEHASQHALGNCAEVMVLELLALRWLCAV